MSSKTTNYDLVKPAGNEYYDVENQNGNMDIIDAELKRQDEETKSHLADKTPHGNIPFAKLFLTSDQSIPNNTLTKVALTVIQGDNDNIADTVNSRLIIQTTGTYLVHGLVVYQTGSIGERAGFLYKNGVLFTAGGLAAVSTSGVCTMGYSILLPFVSGDYIELYVRQGSGAAINVSGAPDGSRTNLAVLRIGD